MMGLVSAWSAAARKLCLGYCHQVYEPLPIAGAPLARTDPLAGLEAGWRQGEAASLLCKGSFKAVVRQTTTPSFSLPSLLLSFSPAFEELFSFALRVSDHEVIAALFGLLALLCSVVEFRAEPSALASLPA